VTSHPTDAWVAQQLREATPFDTRPRFLIRDNDRKYGTAFARAASGIDVLRTPIRAPPKPMLYVSVFWAVYGANA